MTDYTDLIARLRNPKRDWPEFGYDRTEAADAIAALQAEVARLREQMTGARGDEG